MSSLLLINTLGGVDIAFFVACAVIIAAIVGIYFLIPVINKKQYQEQRENLKKREEAFKTNMRANTKQNSEAIPEENAAEGEKVEQSDQA